MVDYHFMVFLSNFMLSWNRLLSAYAAAWTRLGLRPRRLVQSRKAHLCRWAFTDACRGELFYSFVNTIGFCFFICPKVLYWYRRSQHTTEPEEVNGGAV